MALYVVCKESGTVLTAKDCVLVDSDDLSSEELEDFGDSDAETIQIAKLYGKELNI